MKKETKNQIISCRIPFKVYDEFEIKCRENQINISDILRKSVYDYLNDVIDKNKLSAGDKLICWEKGGAYGDTFTVQDPLYEEGMILQCDKSGGFAFLKDIDLSNYQLD